MESTVPYLNGEWVSDYEYDRRTGASTDAAMAGLFAILVAMFVRVAIGICWLILRYGWRPLLASAGWDLIFNPGCVLGFDATGTDLFPYHVLIGTLAFILGAGLCILWLRESWIVDGSGESNPFHGVWAASLCVVAILAHATSAQFLIWSVLTIPWFWRWTDERDEKTAFPRVVVRRLVSELLAVLCGFWLLFNNMFAQNTYSYAISQWHWFLGYMHLSALTPLSPTIWGAALLGTSVALYLLIMPRLSQELRRQWRGFTRFTSSLVGRSSPLRRRDSPGKAAR